MRSIQLPQSDDRDIRINPPQAPVGFAVAAIRRDAGSDLISRPVGRGLPSEPWTNQLQGERFEALLDAMHGNRSVSTGKSSAVK